MLGFPSSRFPRPLVGCCTPREARLPVSARAPEAASWWRVQWHPRKQLPVGPAGTLASFWRVQGHPCGGLVSSSPASSPVPKGLLSKSDGTSLPHGQLPGESCRHPTVGGGVCLLLASSSCPPVLTQQTWTISSPDRPNKFLCHLLS